MNEPLYYDPRNPHSYRANSSVMNYSDPYHNAAYLPRTQAYDADPGHQPGFGYIPTTRVHPDEHPFHFRGRFFHPEFNDTRFPHVSNLGPENVYRGYRSVIPYQVPIPGYHHNSPDSEDTNGEWYHGTSHPVYAAWYVVFSLCSITKIKLTHTHPKYTGMNLVSHLVIRYTRTFLHFPNLTTGNTKLRGLHGSMSLKVGQGMILINMPSLRFRQGPYLLLVVVKRELHRKMHSIIVHFFLY